MDIEVKAKHGVVSFKFDLPNDISENLWRLWHMHGSGGENFMVICQPIDREGSWKLVGRMLEQSSFSVIQNVIDGETEKQRYNNSKKED